MEIRKPQMAARSDFVKTLTPNTGQVDPVLYPILFPEDTTNGTDGDDWSALSFEDAVQRLLNRVEKNKLDIAATLAALNALVVVNADDDAAILSAANAIANHIANTTDAHDATAISVALIAGVSGTNAQTVLTNLRVQISALETINAGTRLTTLESKQAQSFTLSIADNPGYTSGTNYGDGANSTIALGNFSVPAAFQNKRVLATVSAFNNKNPEDGSHNLYLRFSGTSAPYPSNAFMLVGSIVVPSDADPNYVLCGSGILMLPNTSHLLHLDLTTTNPIGLGDSDAQTVVVTLIEL